MDKDEWHNLFDTAQLDHVIELVRDDLKAKQVGGQSRLYYGLRDILLPQIDQYITQHNGILENGRINSSRIDIDAAYQLFLFVDALAERIEKGKPRVSEADDLELLWLRFIASAAGHLVYHSIPKVHSDKSKAGKRSAQSRREKARNKGSETLNKAADALLRLREKKGDLDGFKTYTIGEIARESGLNERRLRKLTLAVITTQADSASP